MIKQFVTRLRYNFYVSRLILWTVLPLVYLGKLSNWIKRRVKVNGMSVPYYGIRLKFPRNTGIGVLSRIYWAGESGFEQYFGRYMIDAFCKADIFMDVGSNFGFYSVVAIKTNNQIFSYCFEPVDFLRSDNERFHEINDVSRYEVLAMAAGDRDGTADILIPDQKNLKFMITSATLSKSFAGQKGFNVIQKPTHMIRLDSFYKEHIASKSPVPSNIVIKIDVEGFELAVLKGAMELMDNVKPVIFVEIFICRENIARITELLSLVNYQIYLPFDVGLVTIELNEHYAGERNFVLLPRTGLLRPFILTSEFERIVFCS